MRYLLKPLAEIGKASNVCYHAERRHISNTRRVQQRQWPGTKAGVELGYTCLLKTAGTCPTTRSLFQTVSQVVAEIPKLVILCVIGIGNLAALFGTPAAAHPSSLPMTFGPGLPG